MTIAEHDLRSALHGVLCPGGGDIAPSLDGWTDGPASTMRREVRQEVIHASRIPDTVEGVRREIAHWSTLPMPKVWVRARIAVLIERLEILERPGDELEIEAGTAKSHAHAREEEPGQAVQSALIPPPGHPSTTQEKARQAVRALLGTGISNREIARRVGVSPSTVAAVQKAVG